MIRPLLLLLTLLAAGLAHAEADVATGDALFKRNCGNCHKVGQGARAAFGRSSMASLGEPRAPQPTTAIRQP